MVSEIATESLDISNGDKDLPCASCDSIPLLKVVLH